MLLVDPATLLVSPQFAFSSFALIPVAASALEFSSLFSSLLFQLFVRLSSTFSIELSCFVMTLSCFRILYFAPKSISTATLPASPSFSTVRSETIASFQPLLPAQISFAAFFSIFVLPT